MIFFLALVRYSRGRFRIFSGTSLQRSQASVFVAASTALVCYRYTPVRPHISISMHFCFRRISPLLTETTSQLSGIANINTRILFLIETPMLPRNDSSSIERVLNLVPSKKGMFVFDRERERERERNEGIPGLVSLSFVFWHRALATLPLAFSIISATKLESRPAR